jgi:hypothetical protein
MSPGGQQGRLIVQRDRPCTLEAGSSDKPLPDPTTTLRPPPTGRFAALTNTPLTQTGFDLVLRRRRVHSHQAENGAKRTR